MLDFLSDSEKKISRSAAGESAWKETPDADSSSSVSVPIKLQVQISAKENIGETESLSHRGSTLQMTCNKEIYVAATNNSADLKKC